MSKPLLSKYKFLHLFDNNLFERIQVLVKQLNERQNRKFFNKNQFHLKCTE